MSQFKNKRKILIINKRNILVLFIIFILFFISIFINNNLPKLNMIINKNIVNFSEKFEYNLNYFQVEGLKILLDDDIIFKINKYKKTSIFLLPLKKISLLLKEISWIKNVKLSTNYKDTLYVNIEEYVPVGIYFFNGKNYYFDSSGKIIDEVSNKEIINQKLIFFYGQSSKKHANNLLEDIKFETPSFHININHAIFISQRRWNLLLNNGIILKLEEKNPILSIKNYLKLKKNLSKDQINNIKVIDLRNFQKAIIEFK